MSESIFEACEDCGKLKNVTLADCPHCSGRRAPVESTKYVLYERCAVCGEYSAEAETGCPGCGSDNFDEHFYDRCGSCGGYKIDGQRCDPCHHTERVVPAGVPYKQCATCKDYSRDEFEVCPRCSGSYTRDFFVKCDICHGMFNSNLEKCPRVHGPNNDLLVEYAWETCAQCGEVVKESHVCMHYKAAAERYIRERFQLAESVTMGELEAALRRYINCTECEGRIKKKVINAHTISYTVLFKCGRDKEICEIFLDGQLFTYPFLVSRTKKGNIKVRLSSPRHSRRCPMAEKDNRSVHEGLELVVDRESGDVVKFNDPNAATYDGGYFKIKKPSIIDGKIKKCSLDELGLFINTYDVVFKVEPNVNIQRILMDGQDIRSDTSVKRTKKGNLKFTIRPDVRVSVFDPDPVFTATLRDVPNG